MARALSTASITRIVLDSDSDKGSPSETTWHVGVLDGYQTRYTYGLLNSGLEPIEADLMVISFGLKGFENFKDEDGNDLKFSTVKTNIGKQTYDVVDPAIIGRIPMNLASELANKIIKGADRVTEEEAKN